MARAHSKVEQGAETAKRLTHVGHRLFSEYGYHGVASETIVEAADLSRGALYHHFDGKLGLFEAVFINCERKIVERIGSAARREKAPRDQLVAGSLAFLSACADPDLRRVVIDDAPSVLGWSRWRQIDADHGLSLLRSAIKDLEMKGQLASYSVDALVYLLSGAMNELAMWVAESDNPKAALKTAKLTLNALLQEIGR